MNKEQAAQLGLALAAWSRGAVLEVRHFSGDDRTWYPFEPADYEKINVQTGLEWRVANVSAKVPVGQRPSQPARR